MNIPGQFAEEFAKFPPLLRKLVEAELKSGNAIAAIAHGFPAAPCGAFIKLARPVDTRRRKAGGGLSFYERNSPEYAGEFTTDERHFFVLEPPPPTHTDPDMHALCTEREARQRAADAALYASQARTQIRVRKSARKVTRDAGPTPRPPAPAESSKRAVPTTLVGKFRESMICTYERWHDGIGYDVELLNSATPEELIEIENLLVNRPVENWRDVEALAALNTPRAQGILRKAIKSSDSSIPVAVARYAPGLMSDARRTAMLVKALQTAASFDGLSQTLLEVERFHPPEVIAALLRGVLDRDGETAVQFAAMLMFLHGKAKSAFDWEQRPFFLRFNTEDTGERAAACRDLCEQIEVRALPAAQRTSVTRG